MKISCRLALSVALACSSALSFANQALAQQKNCMACHAVGSRVVGPSFKDVAAKYASQDGSVDEVAERIVKGSTGRWGMMPMPPNVQVTPAEAKVLAAWILQQK